MSYTLTIVQKSAYIHAIVTGSNNLENVRHYLAEIGRECAARNCQRALIEERLEGPRLDTTSVFRAAADGSSAAHGQFRAIAYVDVYAEGDLMKFAETVALNRGLPVRVFATVPDAEKWLQDTIRGSAERDAAAQDKGRP